MSKETGPNLSKLARLVITDVREAVLGLPEKDQAEYKRAQESVINARRNAPGKEGEMIVFNDNKSLLFVIIDQVIKDPYIYATPEQIASNESGIQSIIDARRSAIQNEGQLPLY